MRAILLTALLTLTAATRASATFSIIAFDPATGELGVGVQSHAFTAGAAVPYAIPGIGAVATQVNLGTPRKLTDRSAELAKAGKFAEAIAVEREALAIQPNSDVLRYALAQRYAQAGQPLPALVELRETIRLHPNLARQAAADPIFTSLRELAEFKRLIQAARR